MFKNFIGGIVRNSRAFKTVVATEQNNLNVDVKRAGTGEYGRITNNMPMSVYTGMPLLMASFRGGKAILGVSPFVSNNTVVEVERK